MLSWAGPLGNLTALLPSMPSLNQRCYCAVGGVLGISRLSLAGSGVQCENAHGNSNEVTDHGKAPKTCTQGEAAPFRAENTWVRAIG